MKSFFTRNRLILLTATIIAVSAAVLVGVTDICRLHAVTVDGRPMLNWNGKYGLSESRLLIQQPISLVATELLGSDDVVKVDVDFDLPNTIRIRTNDYTPTAFLADRSTGDIWGLDQSGRIVPLDKNLKAYDLPFFTGLVAGRAYGGCDDLRVVVALNQLAILKATDPDAAAVIGEVNFSDSDFLIVRLEGLETPVRVSTDRLARQLAAVVNFIKTFQPDLSDAVALDPRFGNLVVKECVVDTTSDTKDTTSHSTMEAFD